MSLTVADLPGILADLARLEPERFRALESDGVYEFLVDGLPWNITGRASAASLALVQAAVQEAIVARGWLFEFGTAEYNGPSRTPGAVRASMLTPAIASVYSPTDNWGAWRVSCADSDLPAVAISSAYRDALLAQQEPA